MLLILSIVASKLGDWIIFWGLVFTAIIQPLVSRLRNTQNPQDNDIIITTEKSWVERHWILAKFIPLYESLESKIPRYQSESLLEKINSMY